MSQALEVRGRAVVAKRAAMRLHAGHLWVYASDVVRGPDSGPGVVALEDEQGRNLGLALYSPASVIRLRRLTRSAAPMGPDDLRARLQKSLTRRQTMLGAADAYRWVHGEADMLPSIFIDRYADCVSLQILSGGGDVLEALLVELIVELTAPRAVVIRNDATARRREGLREHVTVAVGQGPVIAQYHEGKITYDVDLLADQKTGGFLDQSYNHLAAATYARGQALDCFTYHGGFALQWADRAHEITAVDQSAPALERVKSNAARAHIDNIHTVLGDVFDVLRDYARAGKRFDTVALDPPAFASNKASEVKALRAYRDLNAQAMKVLTPGGVLITCSCSGRITPSVFDDMLADAAAIARRHVQLVERRGAGPDPPVLVGMPETEYLKCRVTYVL